MSELYYTAPTDEQFEELKQAAIEVWQTYDNTYGYVDEKVGRIKDMQNVKDNFMYMVAMFDTINQTKLSFLLSPETCKAVSDRMKDGGQPDLLNPFLR